jgi:hypothetical protein
MSFSLVEYPHFYVTETVSEGYFICSLEYLEGLRT